MAEHPIQGLMNVTMEKIHQMVDSNTIIGKPITTEDGITILPVSKVSFGFASGGTDFNGKNAANKDLFGGGSGAGVNIQPVAFLVIKDGCVRTIQLSDSSNSIDRALTMLPELVEKLFSIPLVVVIHYLIKWAGLIGHFNFPCQQHSCKRTYAEHIFLRSVYFCQRYFLALFTSHCLVLLSDKFLYISVDILEHIRHEGV